MPKPPRVEYVVTKPSPPTWWRRNRHLVLLCIGLFLGYQLCSNAAASGDHPRPEPGNRPSETASVEPLPTRTP